MNLTVEPLSGVFGNRTPDCIAAANSVLKISNLLRVKQPVFRRKGYEVIFLSAGVDRLPGLTVSSRLTRYRWEFVACQHPEKEPRMTRVSTDKFGMLHEASFLIRTNPSYPWLR